MKYSYILPLFLLIDLVKSFNIALFKSVKGRTPLRGSNNLEPYDGDLLSPLKDSRKTFLKILTRASLSYGLALQLQQPAK